MANTLNALNINMYDGITMAQVMKGMTYKYRVDYRSKTVEPLAKPANVFTMQNGGKRIG